jgi:hypothetical protein
MEKFVLDWKKWLDDSEQNEFRPFKNHILPTFTFIDENITEEDYFNLINQINKPLEGSIINDKYDTQTSSSFGQNAFLPT